MRGRLHEFYAATDEDDAANLGLAALRAMQIAADAPILWIRVARRQGKASPYAPGLVDLGVDPGRLILVEANDVFALLRTAGDAARCPGLGALLVETQGRLPELDLTASRRLLLAAERSRVTVLLARHDASPVPSAAETRWRVAAAPSSRLGVAMAPGPPAFIVELLRRRGGPAGSRWCLEWNREQASFRETALSGAMVSSVAGGADRARQVAVRPFRTAA